MASYLQICSLYKLYRPLQSRLYNKNTLDMYRDTSEL